MRFLHHNHSKLSSISSSFYLMGSIPLCKSTSLAFLSHLSSSSSSSSSQKYFLYRTNPLLHGPFPVQPMSQGKPFSMKPNGVSSFTSNASVPRPPAFLENPLDGALNSTKLNVLRKKLEELNIDIESCVPGQTNRLLCPMCKGGDSGERSFSLYISEDGGAAVWMCFRAKCGWKGRTLAFADGQSSFRGLGQVKLNQNKRKITVESLQLEPLCDQLVSYFAERLISKNTLLRNSVMQKRSNNDQVAVAFTYFRRGALISCKYRDNNKKFWQEANTEKIFYGLDDIDGASDIIIVEGEIDKLSMAEAGFHNCVSVPDGAPPSVSQKDVPPTDQLGYEVSVSMELQRLLE